MEPILRLPDDFEDYAWEVEAKGVFWDAWIALGGLELPVTFYDPVRLAQDVEEDVKSQRSFAVRHLIVVGRLTIEEMTTAVAALPPGFFGGDS